MSSSIAKHMVQRYAEATHTISVYHYNAGSGNPALFLSSDPEENLEADGHPYYKSKKGRKVAETVHAFVFLHGNKALVIEDDSELIFEMSGMDSEAVEKLRKQGRRCWILPKYAENPESVSSIAYVPINRKKVSEQVAEETICQIGDKPLRDYMEDLMGVFRHNDSERYVHVVDEIHEVYASRLRVY